MPAFGTRNGLGVKLVERSSIQQSPASDSRLVDDGTSVRREGETRTCDPSSWRSLDREAPNPRVRSRSPWQQTPDDAAPKNGRRDHRRDRGPPDRQPAPAVGHSRGRLAARRAFFLDPLQRVGQIARRLPARIHRLCQALADHALECGRGRQFPRRKRWRILRQDRRDQAGVTLSFERPRAGGHLVEHRAKREDICPGISLLAFELLRRHIRPRPEDAAFVGQRRLARRSERGE